MNELGRIANATRLFIEPANFPVPHLRLRATFRDALGYEYESTISALTGGLP